MPMGLPTEREREREMTSKFADIHHKLWVCLFFQVRLIHHSNWNTIMNLIKGSLKHCRNSCWRCVTWGLEVADNKQEMAIALLDTFQFGKRQYNRIVSSKLFWFHPLT